VIVKNKLTDWRGRGDAFAEVNLGFETCGGVRVEGLGFDLRVERLG
jgi:hypothetical protein